MPLKTTNPVQTEAWKKLEDHFNTVKDIHIKELFAKDPERAMSLTIAWEDFYVDFSKNRITEETIALLLELAAECGLKDAIADYFSGVSINKTEERAVLHTALRAKETDTILVDGINVIPEVVRIKQKIKHFSEEIIRGKKKGYTGKVFTDVVNVGIGGSDLGPVMVTEALQCYKNHLNTHFVSNVDGDHLQEIIQKLDPETTLFIIVSKSFTTQETLANAQTIRAWFLKHATEAAIAGHFVAVSTNLPQIAAFGIHEDHIFPMWDWVGGRFSLWSAVGLSIALSVGYDNFERLLEGARKMDNHFRETTLAANIPVIMAMLSVWYNNFFKAESEAIIPYTQYLSHFPSYLQQAVMESNGKSTDRSGHTVSYQTGTIIWGAPGTNAQHAFFQLIHQGTKLIPTDFIGFTIPLHGHTEHHHKLMANFFAQTEALLNGKTKSEVLSELKAKQVPEATIEKLWPFKVFEGNKPTTTILIDKLTPEALGTLIALYEHKIFVQGVIWNIFSFDQWGVELGKQLANTILKDISSTETASHDTSTLNLLKAFKQKQP
ncbi:MAG: glucose-6-phosphate isomerase [Bacteroidota bacterium]